MHPREYEAALGFRENKESLHSSPNAARRRAEAYGFVPETQNPQSAENVRAKQQPHDF